MPRQPQRIAVRTRQTSPKPGFKSPSQQSKRTGPITSDKICSVAFVTGRGFRPPTTAKLPDLAPACQLPDLPPDTPFGVQRPAWRTHPTPVRSPGEAPPGTPDTNDQARPALPLETPPSGSQTLLFRPESPVATGGHPAQEGGGDGAEPAAGDRPRVHHPGRDVTASRPRPLLLSLTTPRPYRAYPPKSEHRTCSPRARTLSVE